MILKKSTELKCWRMETLEKLGYSEETLEEMCLNVDNASEVI